MKKPKFYRYPELECMSYPITDNLHSNSKQMTRMAEIIKELFLKRKSDSVVIVGRGSSGAIIGSYITLLLGAQAHFVHVKKKGEHSHASHRESGYYIRNAKQIIVVDDFVCTGNTILNIYEEIQNLLPANKKGKLDALVVTNVIERNAMDLIEDKFNNFISK